MQIKKMGQGIQYSAECTIAKLDGQQYWHSFFFRHTKGTAKAKVNKIGTLHFISSQYQTKKDTKTTVDV